MTVGNNFTRTKAKPLPKFSVDFNKIQKAKIKSVTDLSHNGKLLVWLIDSNTNEDVQENWVSVGYASPFAGCTDRAKVNRQATQSFAGTQKSYGFYAIPPDINNYVLVAFANGDPTQGYWIACIQQDTMTHMIPGIGQDKSYTGQGPVAEMNIYSGQIGTPQNNPIRPMYTPLFNGVTQQGLINDPLRGVGNASMWRSDVPDVVGILTPGANQLIMDDNSNSKMIRLRTQSGAQILISETDGSIYAINKSGTGWFELNNNGNIYAYASGSYSVRADQDVNLSAGRNVNVQSDSGTINLNSKNNVNIQAGTGVINLDSGNDLNLQAAGQLNLNVTGNIVGTGANIHLNGPSAGPAGPADSPVIVPTHEPFSR